MKKFTLFVASLFLAIGTMAQTLADGIYTIQADENGKRGYLAAGNYERPVLTDISWSDYAGNSAEALENGIYWYVKTVDGVSYLYNVANGQFVIDDNTANIYFSAEPASTFNITEFNGYIHVGSGTGTRFLSMGCGAKAPNQVKWETSTPSDGGCLLTFTAVENGTTTYAAAIAAADAAIASFVPVVQISNPSEFVNGKVYTFVTSRGTMGASETSTNAISTARNTTADVTTDYFKWTVYKSGDNFYLYNIGKAMFLGEQSSTGDAAVPMSATPAKVTFQTTTKAGYPIMFTTLNDGKCSVNHSANHAEGLITWNGGWTDRGDDGNCHVVTEVADLDAAVLAIVEAAVNALEADNTEAVAELDAAIASAQTLFTQITLGTGLGEYTAPEGYMAAFNDILAFRQGIQSTNDPTPDQIRAKIAELQALIASFSLNMPVAGNYYRIMAVEGWNDDARYLGSQNSTAKAGRAEFVAEADANTIFYYDGTHMLSYASGNYLVSNSSFLGYKKEDIGLKTSVAFEAASEVLVGAYRIKFNDGSRYLFVNQSNYTDAGGGFDTRKGYCFNIEAVTELPVSITAAGYATFYAPVAVQLPAEVTAHTVAIEGEWATLSKAYNAVPAGNGVILAGAEGNYNFTIVESAAAIENNILQGTAAATYIEDEAYVLALNAEGDAALCKAQIANSVWLNNSHKAYLPASEVPVTEQGAASFSFRFEGTTGIEGVEVENTVKAIFDLTGRRIEAISAPGIYIVNGKKVLVK